MARTVGFTDIGFSGCVSFLSSLTRGTDEDKFVEVGSNGTVDLAEEDDQIQGIVRVIDQHDKLASVQIDGFVTMAYDTGHDAPALGMSHLVVGDAPTKAKHVTGDIAVAPRFLVVSVDTSAHTVTFKLG